MAEKRFYVDKKRVEEIRALTKGKEYLPFDNSKDIFMYAMALGCDLYTGGTLESTKEGFFHDKDLNPYDEAMLYAMVGNEIDNIEELTDQDKIYAMAEGIADKGFSIVLDEAEKYSGEALILKLLKRTNELYKDGLEAGAYDL